MLRDFARRKICKILSSNILRSRRFAKYYPQISLKYLVRRKICKILSSNIFAKSLSIEFNQEDENLKVSTQRNSTEFCFPPDRGYILIFVRFFKYLLGNLICSIFNFVISQILPISFLLPVKRKFWKHLVSPPASSAISFHLSVEAKTFQNFLVQQTLKYLRQISLN